MQLFFFLTEYPSWLFNEPSTPFLRATPRVIYASVRRYLPAAPYSRMHNILRPAVCATGG